MSRSEWRRVARRGSELPASATDTLTGMEWVDVGKLLIPLVVVVFGFWFALRQDKIRWARERRTDLYIDLLAEAYAEHEWMATELTALEMFAVGEPHGNGALREAEYREKSDRLPDARLPARERAVLGVRGLAFASGEVSALFNALRSCYPLGVQPDAAAGLKIKAGLAFDALEQQIREELRFERRVSLKRLNPFRQA